MNQGKNTQNKILMDKEHDSNIFILQPVLRQGFPNLVLRRESLQIRHEKTTVRINILQVPKLWIQNTINKMKNHVP